VFSSSMHCPSLHTSFPMDGLNIFKEKLFGYLAEVYCAPPGTIAYMPPLLSHGDLLNDVEGKQQKLLFHDVFDMEALGELLPHVLLRSSKTDEDNSQKESFNFIDRSFQDTAICKRKTTKPFPSAAVCSDPTRRDTGALSDFVTVAGRDKFFQVMVALQPAKPIVKIAEDFVDAKFSNGGKRSFMCLHLRTEPDFKNFFVNPPAYYSPEDYVAKITKHMQENPEYYKGVENVYVTGDHNQKYFESTILPLFGHLFKNFYGHQDFAEFGYDKLKNIQRSALDQYLCSKAHIFIGNSHSGFSELTFYLRMGMKAKENGGDGPDEEDMLDFMVNSDQDNSEDRGAPMQRMNTPNLSLVS
jgi:hypothetical protein